LPRTSAHCIIFAVSSCSVFTRAHGQARFSMRRGTGDREGRGSMSSAASSIAMGTAPVEQTSDSRPSEYPRDCWLICAAGSESTVVMAMSSPMTASRLRASKQRLDALASSPALKGASWPTPCAIHALHGLSPKGLATRLIAEFLGTSEAMILKHYGHRAPDYQEEAALAIGQKRRIIGGNIGAVKNGS